MKKNRLLIFIIMILVVFPITIYSETTDNINYISKEATFDKENNKVIIDIQTQNVKNNINYLVYQGTNCTAHGLNNDKILKMINLLTKNGDIDYYSDATHYSSATRYLNPIKHFEKNQTITLNDIYKTNGTGTHIVSQASFDTLMSRLESGKYDYLIMIIDGGFATGLSAGTSTAIFNVKNSLKLTDEEYITRMNYAKKLSQIPILYITSPLEKTDKKVTWDFDATTAYSKINSYWNDSYYSNKYSIESLRYLNAHLFVEGTAFMAPNYYLKIIDPITGKIKLNTAPSIEDIEYDLDNYVSYDDLDNVLNILKNTENYFVSTKTIIEDTLADGLNYLNSSIEYYDEENKKWLELNDEDVLAKSIIDDNNKLTITIDDPKALYNGKKIRVVINTSPSKTFGSDGNPTFTNKECNVFYENEEGIVILKQSKESPSVIIPVFTINYDGGDNGTIEGVTSEIIKENNLISGTDINIDKGYINIGWVCDKDVLLKDDTIIKSGEIISNDQIPNIVATEDINLIAKYEPILYSVEYKINGDFPSGVKIPTDTQKYKWHDEVNIQKNFKDIKGVKDGIPGIWKFNGWEANEGIIENKVEDNVVYTGTWVFIPKEQDINPQTLDKVVYMMSMLIISFIGIITSSIIYLKQSNN